ncbi:MAG: choice-of-anchor L domain-containing protein [Candidatus Eisenbacteria bacterium]
MTKVIRFEHCTSRLGLAHLAWFMLLASPALAATQRPTATNYVAPRRALHATTPAASATELLQCLLGPDVVVSNAVLNAAPLAAGTFTGALSVVGFDQGVILSSGDIGTLSGPNTGDATSTISGTPGDPDLDALIPGYTTYDAAILEFDFTCSTAQDVVFQYAFGSEEYNEWVNSPFNDVFGFFLNGVNIAQAPVGCSNAGTPVSINNVNCGNPYVGVGPNCDCFRNNDLNYGGGTINTELDGLTQVFFATGTILPGINHIKLAIADAGDQVLDSDVMIRCQSFTCGQAPITGACCLTSGQCVTLTAADCSANGGTYHGNNSACVPNLCGASFGACCFPDQTCEVEDPDLCATNGGTYQGDGVLCNPNPCGAPVGACCYGAGQCTNTDPNGCSGLYMGDWTGCDPNPCLSLTGACCADVAACEIKVFGTCGDTFLGVGTTCDPNPCEAIIGACCNDQGVCKITLQADCGDFYQGDRTVCDPNPCAGGGPSAVGPAGGHPAALALEVPVPTPTTGYVDLTWSSPASGAATLTLWDASGRLIRTLFEGQIGSTTHRGFALVDGAGRELANGVYWLRLEQGHERATQKVVLSR